jgi:N-carbamoylputrescine amidase
MVMSRKPLRIALIQMSCEVEPRRNLDKAIARIDEAAARGAQLICLQELFRSRYFCQSEDALAAAAAARKVAIVGSIFERRAEGIYHNTAVVLDSDGRLAGRYRKMHIPDDPHYYEKFYFTPGDLGFRNFETRYSRIGVLVCWDQWYPEGARITSLQGANVLFYPTAIGWHPAEKEQYGEAQLDAWRTMQRAHAIANGVFVAAVNRTGFEGPAESGIEFWGNSFISDPFGRVIAQASATEAEVVVAECDPKDMDEVRKNWPFLRDRRIDAYSPIVQRWLD